MSDGNKLGKGNTSKSDLELSGRNMKNGEKTSPGINPGASASTSQSTCTTLAQVRRSNLMEDKLWAIEAIKKFEIIKYTGEEIPETVRKAKEEGKIIWFYHPSKKDCTTAVIYPPKPN